MKAVICSLALIAGGVAFPAWAAPGSPSAPAVVHSAPTYLAAQIMGDEIRVPVPEGYCEPTGPYIAQAQVLAAVDLDNITVLQLNSCAQMAAGVRVDHFAVIKVAKKTMTAKVTLPELLAGMGQVSKGDLAKVLNGEAMQKRVKEGLGQVTTNPIELKTDVQPVDADDAAYYLAGAISAQVGENGGQLSLAIAITSVRGHLVSYDFFEPGGTPKEIAEVLAQTKREVRRLLKAN